MTKLTLSEEGVSGSVCSDHQTPDSFNFVASYEYLDMDIDADFYKLSSNMELLQVTNVQSFQHLLLTV